MNWKGAFNSPLLVHIQWLWHRQITHKKINIGASPPLKLSRGTPAMYIYMFVYVLTLYTYSCGMAVTVQLHLSCFMHNEEL